MPNDSPKVTVRLPAKLLASLKKQAGKKPGALSNLIRDLLAKALEVEIKPMPRGHGSAKNPEKSARKAANARWEKSSE